MGRKKVENPKGNGYIKPCQNCQTPCYGTRCRRCSFSVRPMLARLGDLRRVPTKRTGARNPEWGSGENGKFSVVITKPEMPTSSWWTETDFGAAYRRELPRLLSVKVSGTPQVNTVFD